jgi:hypothetical protein
MLRQALETNYERMDAVLAGMKRGADRQEDSSGSGTSAG